ncbi:guanine nucleotide-exchange factor SEC12 [Eucyclogobius newberryi]|uniref:guanine nucleotide-exchange factor SEC12 n=1 Tax=Eucyclogobius newberryi TaxID=166745 RepID=UPI003B5B2E32
MWKRKVPDLYRAPFPLYAVKVDPGTGLVVVAGGGGASKTGIKNALHFLELQRVGEHEFGATLLHAHDTETRANMNLALADDVIAAGQDGQCCVMKFKRSASDGTKDAATKDGNGPQQSAPRRRAGKGEKPAPDAEALKDETPQLQVQGLGEVQSDANPQDPLQKVVRFSRDRSLLLTGGTDGHIRVWEFPSLKKKYDFKAHEDEIEDLDLSPGNKLVTVGRDFSCSVWSGDQLATSLQWHKTRPGTGDKTYRYMACRFGAVEDQKEALRLYTVQIPHKRDRKPPPCYVTKWDGKSFLPMLTAPCGPEVVSALAVSDSGTFLGLGTVTGSVALYIAFSLQKLYYVRESHGIVVTDLAFLPDSPRGRQLRGNHEAAMLSVAVDSRCQLHALRHRMSCPVWLVLLCCGLMVVVVILLLQNLFPGLL